MLDKKYREAAREVIDILEHTEQEAVNKISKKLLIFLKENAAYTYVPRLDHSKSLYQMNLKKETKEILAVIYKCYWSGNRK